MLKPYINRLADEDVTIWKRPFEWKTDEKGSLIGEKRHIIVYTSLEMMCFVDVANDVFCVYTLLKSSVNSLAEQSSRIKF